MSAPGLVRHLTVRLTTGAIVLWLVAVGLAAWAQGHEMREAFDSALEETALRLLPLALDDLGNRPRPDRRPGRPLGAEDDDRDDDEDRDAYLIYQVRDAQGAVLLRSHDAPARPFAVALRPGFATHDGLRLYTAASAGRDLFIQVGEPLAHRREALLESSAVLLLPLAVLVPVMVLGIRFTVRRGLAPVTDLGQAIAERAPGNLGPVTSDALPREIAPIAEAVNRLMDRLRHALEAERTLAANAAHELRTPVAGALAQTQRLVARLADTEDRRHARQVEAALHHLGDLTAKLLQLSRAEAGIALSDRPQDILAVARVVVDEARRALVDPGRLAFDDGGHPAVMARIDVDAFAIVLRNLIENALRHGTEDQPVQVSIDARGRFRVVNGGPVVPGDRLAGLVRPFTRDGGAGTGLGLAIVTTILGQTGGNLALHSPARGRCDGFEALVTPDGAGEHKSRAN